LEAQQWKKRKREKKPKSEGHLRKVWGRLWESKKKKSGMEWECLSILRRAKEIWIEERHSKCQKSKKKIELNCGFPKLGTMAWNK
jgi:hypothetical protein